MTEEEKIAFLIKKNWSLYSDGWGRHGLSNNDADKAIRIQIALDNFKWYRRLFIFLRKIFIKRD